MCVELVLVPNAEAVGGTVRDGATLAGGGSAPGAGVPSPMVVVAVPNADAVAAALRALALPILARVTDGALVLDLRTVDPADDDHVRQALLAALPE